MSDRDNPHALANSGQPYVVDRGRLRAMHFNREEIQSAMWIAEPDRLYLEYTRLMMGFVLFIESPDTLLTIGLGGGSIIKFCHRHLLTTQLIAVEIDAAVIALRSQFCIPDDDARLQIRHADGVDYLAQCGDATIPLLLLDGFGGSGIPAALSSQRFYDECARVLGESGLLVANLHEQHADFGLQLARIQRCFSAVLEVREGERGNCIVFAGGAWLHERLHNAVLRRPEFLDREAWSQLKSSCARIIAAIRQNRSGDPGYLLRDASAR